MSSGIQRCTCEKGIQGVPRVRADIYCYHHAPDAPRPAADEGDHPMPDRRHLRVVTDTEIDARRADLDRARHPAAEPDAYYWACLDQVSFWAREAEAALTKLHAQGLEPTPRDPRHRKDIQGTME